jgi:polar amino acid transport system substrate-binding protein
MTDRADTRIANLVKAEQVRVALYVPQYTKDPATGELSGWIIDLVNALGERIGVRGVPVEHPNPADALTSVATASCDIAIIGIEATRATRVDFTQPLFEADFTLLARAGSPFQSIADADCPGVRVAAVRNHASTMALTALVKHATLIYADMPDPAFEILQKGEVDLFASLHEVLRRYIPLLPGSHLLPGRYGFNAIGIAVPKGEVARLAYLNEFVADAKASGLFQRLIDRSGWNGVRVAPPAGP